MSRPRSRGLLFFIELSTRKVQIAGGATDADGLWISQIGRNLMDGVDGIVKWKRYVNKFPV